MICIIRSSYKLYNLNYQIKEESSTEFDHQRMLLRQTLGKKTNEIFLTFFRAIIKSSQSFKKFPKAGSLLSQGQKGKIKHAKKESGLKSFTAPSVLLRFIKFKTFFDHFPFNGFFFAPIR